MKRMMVWLVLLGLCAAAGSVRAQSSDRGDTLVKVFEQFDEKIFMVAKEVGQVKEVQKTFEQAHLATLETLKRAQEYVIALEARVAVLERKVAELEAAQ